MATAPPAKVPTPVSGPWVSVEEGVVEWFGEQRFLLTLPPPEATFPPSAGPSDRLHNCTTDARNRRPLVNSLERHRIDPPVPPRDEGLAATTGPNVISISGGNRHAQSTAG